MTAARSSAVASPPPNGEVLIAGGEDYATTLSSAELSTSEWGRCHCGWVRRGLVGLQRGGLGLGPRDSDVHRAPQPMTTGRASATAASLPNGEVLIAGGTIGVSRH